MYMSSEELALQEHSKELLNCRQTSRNAVAPRPRLLLRRSMPAIPRGSPRIRSIRLRAHPFNDHGAWYFDGQMVPLMMCRFSITTEL